MQCLMWPTTDDPVTCTCSGGQSWNLLDENLSDTSSTKDCEDLCLGQYSDGCCQVNVGDSYPGCWWKSGATASCKESTFETLAVTCSCKVL